MNRIKFILRETRNGLFRKYTGFYLLGFLILCIIANLAMACFRSMYGMNDGAFSYNLIIFAEGVFVIPYYSCIILSDIVFGSKYPDPRIRDGITRELHRFEIYLGKLIATFLMSAILFFIAFGLLLATTALFGMHDGTIDSMTIMDFIEKAGVALPLWMAGISIAQMSLFVHKDKRKAYAAFFVITLVIPRIIMLLGSEAIGFAPCVALDNILITPQFTALQFMFTMDKPKCWTLGIVYSLIACAIGIASYYKRRNFISE